MGGGGGWSVKEEESRRITLEIEEFPVCHTTGFRHDAIYRKWGERRGGHKRGHLEATKSGNAGTYLLHLRKFSGGSVKTQ